MPLKLPFAAQMDKELLVSDNQKIYVSIVGRYSSSELGVVSTIFLGAAVVGVIYVCLAALAVQQIKVKNTTFTTKYYPVSVLKPLYGEEPELYENLLSFCKQDYPEYEVIFSVRDERDDSIPVVRRLMSELDGVRIKLVVDNQVRGSNWKVGCMDNALAAASHDILILADSDIRVDPSYLSAVVSPLSDPEVGVVTCVYTGRPSRGIWSLFGACWINYHFLPSVLACWLLGAEIGCFGSTIVLRRRCLEEIGGFDAIKDRLADDYALGHAVRRLGWRVVLSPYLVETTVSESSVRRLFLHELRWSRTIRALVPIGHYASVIANPVGLALVGSGFAGASWPSLGVLGAAICARWCLAYNVDRHLDVQTGILWLLPARDLFSLIVFVVSLAGSRVTWRGRSIRISADGRIVEPDQTRFPAATDDFEVRKRFVETTGPRERASIKR